MNCIFGIDIGGTEIKIGKFYQDKLVLKTSIRTDVSNNGVNIFPDIFTKIEELLDGDQLLGIGVGVPGPVVKGVVRGAQNLGWGNVEAEKLLQEHYPGIIVRVINDANAAAIGEMAIGSARRFRNFVFVTLGTGIGGGVVINGELYEGFTGSAGEIGHLPVATGKKRLCNCGLYDCHERYASATGLVYSAEEMRKGKKTILNDIELNAKNIFDAAKAGDEVALAAVDFMVEKMAIALSTVAATINPEAFVIGGGVSKAGDFLLTKIRRKFQELCFMELRGTEFVLASLGNDAGIYGAAYEIRKRMEA
ncbi:MAG: ROK family protein [Firmicutes bacterium]|nr:ROK family protein [Bacillota bacterium]